MIDEEIEKEAEVEEENKEVQLEQPEEEIKHEEDESNDVSADGLVRLQKLLLIEDSALVVKLRII